jgi:hypothetical protein
MSTKIKKFCSILTYLKNVDKNLHELIMDLCITRSFTPKKGKGLTFLRPDKDLFDKISKMASGDDPEEAVAALLSLIITEHVPDVSSFKGNSFVTYLSKKLPDGTLSGNNVILSCKSVIKRDEKFLTRKDRSNIAVYVLSDALIPTDTDVVSDEDKKLKTKKVKGGADYREGNIIELFEQVVSKCVSQSKINPVKRDPAMEILVSLCRWYSPDCKENDCDKDTKKNCYAAITSLLTWDTLTSLAIILQPYNSNSNSSYVDSGSIKKWCFAMHDISYDEYIFDKDLVGSYKKYMKVASANASSVAEGIKNICFKAENNASKITIFKCLEKAYSAASNLKDMPELRKKVLQDKDSALAESELRITAAILHNNNNDGFDEDVNHTIEMYKKYNLIKPYMNAGDAREYSIYYYYSGAFLVARSTALVSWPNMDGETITSIIKDDVFIKIDSIMEKSKEGLGAHYVGRHDDFVIAIKKYNEKNKK